MIPSPLFRSPVEGRQGPCRLSLLPSPAWWWAMSRISLLRQFGISLPHQSSLLFFLLQVDCQWIPLPHGCEASVGDLCLCLTSMSPWAFYNAVFTRVNQLQMLSFSHVKLLVFGVMGQTMTGTCVTLLQSMQRRIYQKILMTSVACSHSYLKEYKLKNKKRGRQGETGGDWGVREGIEPNAGEVCSAQTAHLHWFMKCNPILNNYHRPLTLERWQR